MMYDGMSSIFIDVENGQNVGGKLVVISEDLGIHAE